MKKITLFIAILSFASFFASAQQVPNGSFENWTNDSVNNWVTKFTVITPLNFVNKSTNFQDGQSAMEIYSQNVFSNNIPGVATLGKISLNMGTTISATFSGGIPYTDRPLRLKGWYQYSPEGNDSAFTYVILKKWNPLTSKSDTIGIGEFIETAAVGTYTQFIAEINYLNLIDSPDTMNIILASSGLSATADSKFLVDNLVFETNQSVSNNSKLDSYIYPNPSNGIINISLTSNEKTVVSLFNALGQKIYSKTLNNIYSTLDFSNYPKGIYLLELRTDNQRSVKKITLK
jgi:hypothetical protein